MAATETAKGAIDLQNKARTLEACVLALDMIRTGAWHFRARYDDEPAAESLRHFADFVAFHVEGLAIEVRQECELRALDGGRA